MSLMARKKKSKSRKTRDRYRKKRNLRKIKKHGMDDEFILHIPKNMRVPIPDITFLTFKKRFAIASAAGNCSAFGGTSYCDIWLNSVYEPMQNLVNPTAPPPALNLITAVQALVGGFGGVYLGGGTAADNPNGFARWLSAASLNPAGVYSQFLVHNAKITIFCDLGSASDDGVLSIVPIYDYVPQSYNQIQASKFAREKKCSYLNPVKNSLSYSMSPHKMFGFTKKEYDSAAKVNGGDYSGNYNHAPAFPLYWHVSYSTYNGNTTINTINLNIELEYYTELFDVNEIATQ